MYVAVCPAVTDVGPDEDAITKLDTARRIKRVNRWLYLIPPGKNVFGLSINSRVNSWLFIDDIGTG